MGATLGLYGQTGQDQSLALQYYGNGEYEKAAELFEALYKKQPKNYYFQYYFKSLIKLQDYEAAEKLCKKASKKNPNDPTYLIYLGQTYDLMVETEEAEKQYQLVLKKIPERQSSISNVANAFFKVDKLEYALETYSIGAKKLGKDPFLIQKANLYQKLGETDNAIESYLDLLDNQPKYLANVQDWLQAFLDEESDFEKLQIQLYKRIQNNSKSTVYTELLIWQFIQQKDFESALVQVKALDKRMKQDGLEVMRLGASAMQEKDFDAAILAYEYIIDQGIDHPRYFRARQRKLEARQKEIHLTYPIDFTKLKILKSDLLEFSEDYAKKDEYQAQVLKDLAKLEALYFKDAPEAINILTPITEWNSIPGYLKAEIKLDLGDYFLISDDIWESTLTYSQVDKAWKDHPLGEEARFRNAMWSYYQGDFDWAQTQLDVLKGSTSELIANDALKLSVFITDNSGLDTSMESMKLFARAELNTFQNKFSEALMIHEKNLKLAPASMLADDILYAKADILYKMGSVDSAASLLRGIEENYSFDLLADDALFRLADMYENQLQKPEKAMECFQKLILNYKDSLYIVESRRRFRKLRGDLL